MTRKLILMYLIPAVAVLFARTTAVAHAEMFPEDQEAVRTHYVGKPLIFRKCYRLADRLEVSPDGTVKGRHQPGYWTVDGAVQVKAVEFGKDRVKLKCDKLWANIKNDSQLHYFPASVALKGRTDYPQTMEIVFRTEQGAESFDQFKQRVDAVFLSDADSKLSATPPPIAAYIQGAAPQVGIDLASGTQFSGTMPKPISTPAPSLTREALLVGQAGQQEFVLFVDQEGRPSVVGFTRLLHYGLEEATIDAARDWKYEPAMKGGKPVSLRIPASITYERPVQ